MVVVVLGYHNQPMVKIQVVRYIRYGLRTGFISYLLGVFTYISHISDRIRVYVGYNLPISKKNKRDLLKNSKNDSLIWHGVFAFFCEKSHFFQVKIDV